MNAPGSSRPTTPPTRPALPAEPMPASVPDSVSASVPPAPVETYANAHAPNASAASKSHIVPTVVQDGIRVVPPLFELCQVDDLINLIAHMLDRLIQHNDRIPLTPNALTRFHSRAPPAISVRDYLLRIAKYTNVEPCCLLMLLPYVDKVCSRLPTFTISSLTVHRFLIACVSVGSKALSDAFCTNGRYARVGGVSIAEINLLEKEFCEAIDWRLTTSGQVLAHYYTSLVKSHPGYRLAEEPAHPPRTSESPRRAPPVPDQTGPALIPPRLLSMQRSSTASNLPSPVPATSTSSSSSSTNHKQYQQAGPPSASSSRSSSSMSVSSSSVASMSTSSVPSASASPRSGSLSTSNRMSQQADSLNASARPPDRLMSSSAPSPSPPARDRSANEVEKSHHQRQRVTNARRANDGNDVRKSPLREAASAYSDDEDEDDDHDAIIQDRND